jgi:hypothetical protein
MLTSVGWLKPMKVKGLPNSDKPYPNSALCPHTHPHTLPDLAKTSPSCGCPPDLVAALSSGPRVLCPTSPLPSCPAPCVCPTTPSPNAGRITWDVGRRPDTYACSAIGASSPTSVPHPRPVPPTAGTWSRPASAPPMPNSGAPPHKVSAPPCCQVPLDCAPR